MGEGVQAKEDFLWKPGSRDSKGVALDSPEIYRHTPLPQTVVICHSVKLKCTPHALRGKVMSSMGEELRAEAEAWPGLPSSSCPRCTFHAHRAKPGASS